MWRMGRLRYESHLIIYLSLEEIAVSNMVSIEAMVRVLVKRGFITKEEIVDEVKQVKLEQEAKRN